MQDRRQFLTIAGVALGLVPVIAWLERSDDVQDRPTWPITTSR